MAYFDIKRLEKRGRWVGVVSLGLSVLFACGGRADPGGEASESASGEGEGEGESAAEVSGASSVSSVSGGDGEDGPACMSCWGDPPDHACCYETFGEGWFCGTEGECINPPLCEALDCCVPGPGGDAYCSDTFGMGSRCGDEGRCLPPQLPCLDIEDPAQCDSDPGCMAIYLIDMWPVDDSDEWCVGDAFEFHGCIPIQPCDDAETVFCDPQGQRWYASNGCGPAGYEICPTGPTIGCGG